MQVNCFGCSMAVISLKIVHDQFRNMVSMKLFKKLMLQWFGVETITRIYSVERYSCDSMNNDNMPMKIIQNLSMKNGMTFQIIWMQQLHSIIMEHISSKGIYFGDMTTNGFILSVVILVAHQSIGLTVKGKYHSELACKQLPHIIRVLLQGITNAQQ